jgi:hypothetical protein
MARGRSRRSHASKHPRPLQSQRPAQQLDAGKQEHAGHQQPQCSYRQPNRARYPEQIGQVPSGIYADQLQAAFTELTGLDTRI